MDETKNLTSRSRFLGSFVLSYSRLMLDNIINATYGEDRFIINIIDKQIYYGDTDSILVNVDIAKKLQKAGFVGVNNGELTDDLNKIFNKDYIKNKENYEFYKVIDYCAAAAKKYSMMYITPENVIKTKTKINGIIKIIVFLKIH